MRVGILFTSHPDAATEPYPHQKTHERVTREVLQAEEDGFDAIWLAEHHFSNKYGILPDPFSYLAYLAAKTSKIKLGSAVMVVPLHHPLRIVENAAFIDILSNGRFQLGLGSGYRPYEFEGLGVDYEQRREMMQEAIPIILDGFHKKKLLHKGRFYNFNIPDEYEIFPQSIQRPHPPFYLGAGTAGSIKQAAKYGFGLMQGSIPNFAILQEHVALYHSLMHEAPAPLNQNPAFGEADVVRSVYVAPTDEKARQDSEAVIVGHMSNFLRGGSGSYLGDTTEKKSDADFAYDNLVKDTILHGSPDTVIRKIQQLVDFGFTSLMLHYPPYYGVEKTLQMLRLFGKEVLPHVHKMKSSAAIAARKRVAVPQPAGSRAAV